MEVLIVLGMIAIVYYLRKKDKRDIERLGGSPLPPRDDDGPRGKFPPGEEPQKQISPLVWCSPYTFDVERINLCKGILNKFLTDTPETGIKLNLLQKQEYITMTNLTPRVNQFHIPSPAELAKTFLGTSIMPEIGANNGYPFHNILTRTHNGVEEFLLEIALAGFTKEDIKITHKGDVLTIESVDSENNVEINDWNYIHNGITAKKFKRQFALGKNLVLDDASFMDGILGVTFHVEVPESDRPKTIEIK